MRQGARGGGERSLRPKKRKEEWRNKKVPGKKERKQEREHIGGKTEQIWQIEGKGNTGDVFPFLLFPPSVTLII